jgi:hypothetical protein
MRVHFAFIQTIFFRAKGPGDHYQLEVGSGITECIFIIFDQPQEKGRPLSLFSAIVADLEQQ